ncbi:MAG: hypothetical protein FIB06_09550 [Betaproteobacteria bacterium]|nr:hypothetical protein [Betaproteobacteria bacterium]
MSRELLNSWAEYHDGIDRILALAKRQLWIYDEDLAAFRLESPERMDCLQALLAAHPAECLAIALRNTEPLQRNNPRLCRLLATYSHNTAVWQTPDQIGHLRDSLLIADAASALIRFDRDQPRAKLLLDEPDEVRAYWQRFAAIRAEGGTPLATTTIGL